MTAAEDESVNVEAVPHAPLLSTEEATKHYVELWKQTVTVQQHFNDLELRIRSLARTALTFTLGAAGVAAKDGFRIDMFGVGVSAGSAIVAVGLFLWLAFWFVDRIWYHRLLIGSVVHGTALEKELQKVLPHAGLTQAISKSSPSEFRLWGKEPRRVLFQVHSSRKLSIFYLLGAVPLVLLAALLWNAQPPKAATSPKAPVVTGTQQPTATPSTRPGVSPPISSAPGPGTPSK